jgi:CO/xanthine dehydrogenase FAD-binding subunit
MSSVSRVEVERPAAYVRPGSISEAVRLLAATGPKILAGGTDLYPALGSLPPPGNVLDVSGISEMRGITRDAQDWRIGGATCWRDIAQAELPPAFRALQQAARQVGSVQIQNRGTIAGNLCNASPAADGVPPLMILNAEVELASVRGLRRMPLAEFLTGYRRTAITPDELLTAVAIPDPPEGAASSFVKLGARKYLVISIVMAAALVRRDDAGKLRDIRIAIGSASERAQRLLKLEEDLLAVGGGDDLMQKFRDHHFASLRPISDVRASAAYRRAASWQLVTDAIELAARGE